MLSGILGNLFWQIERRCHSERKSTETGEGHQRREEKRRGHKGNIWITSWSLFGAWCTDANHQMQIHVVVHWEVLRMHTHCVFTWVLWCRSPLCVSAGCWQTYRSLVWSYPLWSTLWGDNGTVSWTCWSLLWLSPSHVLTTWQLKFPLLTVSPQYRWVVPSVQFTSTHWKSLQLYNLSTSSIMWWWQEVIRLVKLVSWRLRTNAPSSCWSIASWR